MMRTVVIALLLAVPTANAAETEFAVNPVRKVVTMLQMMMNKIEAEGKKETELHDKYMCYCQTAEATLTESIEEAQTKIPQLESDIKEAVETKSKLEGDLKSHQADRAAAKEAMATATAMREKENAAFLKENGQDKSNLDALTGALAAIEKGNAGGFLQTSAAQLLRKISVANTQIVDMDRQTLVSFLSGSQEEGVDAPASAEIVGILKQLKDEMEKDLAEVEAAEAAAAQNYEELMAAKKAEVESLTAAIEEKMTRVGELGVEIATMKNDLEDTKEALAEDIKFLEDLKKNCALKAKEWEGICKARKDELIALSETIKILNDDDALELFKKTIPSASFIQIQETSGSVRARARAVLKASPHHGPQIDFIELVLSGKKAGFEKVITLIDDMVALLKKEQVADDEKKEYCAEQFDISEDKKKELERSIADSDKAIEETKEMLSTVDEELAALEAGIAALDKSVAEATEQRKEENADYEVLMQNNGAAKELILFAKNRMQKFYNPKLYKPPPKRELTEEERVTLNMGGTLAPTNPPGGIAGTGIGFVQIKAHERMHDSEAPPPPPAGASPHKKSEASGGVLAMMDMLVADIDKEMLAAKMEEKDSQDDYEKLMAESSKKRAEDSKALTDKTAAKADAEANLQVLQDTKSATGTELKAILDYIASLHGDCDFLLENYDMRKDARASEIDAMGKAKAVLNGADYSLLQTGVKVVKSLRGH